MSAVTWNCNHGTDINPERSSLCLTASSPTGRTPGLRYSRYHIAAIGNLDIGVTAIKAHRSWEPYARELAVYDRPKEAGIRKILGFNVPQLLRHENAARVFEMSIVTRPFLLDFAGAYLDHRPEFPDDVWADWELEKREQFGERWPQVQLVLGKLKALGIHMVDVSPSNIAFLD
jgi:hypothetical protein